MKYMLMLLVSVFFFVLTYASAPGEFLPVDLGFLVCLMAIVFGVELLIAHLFVRYQTLQKLILAGFATINILSLNLILNAGFTDLPRFGQALVLLVALFILFTLMNTLDENPRIARVLTALFAFGTIGILAQTILETFQHNVQLIFQRIFRRNLKALCESYMVDASGRLHQYKSCQICQED